MPPAIPKYIVALAVFVSACFFFSTFTGTGQPRSLNNDAAANAPLTPAVKTNLQPDQQQQQTQTQQSTPAPRDCSIDLDLLKSYGYNTTADYVRWDINVVRTPNFKSYGDDLKLPLPAFQSLNLDTEDSKFELPKERCSPTVSIEAPMPEPPVDASHMIFGVSTSLERLEESLYGFAHWASGTNARIVASIDKVWNWDNSRARVERKAEEMGIRLTIFDSYEDTLDRYFGLTRILLQQRDAKTKWAVIIDDDTFFPSMKNLVNRLATYDASKPHYIGAPTESFAQMGIWGYMAYGGGGVFLSLPLLEEIDKVYDECYEFKDTGDKRVARCIYLHTTTKLTWDRGLYQLDLWEASGFYESGRDLPLSLHHWKSWFNHDVVAMGKIASICGDLCQLHRWRFNGGNDQWYFINGFSVIQYSAPMKDMLRMEQTWDDSPWAREEGYAFSLGPLRPRDPAKVSWRLRSAIPEGNTVRQVYVNEALPEDPVPDRPPQVIEIVWTVSSN